MFEMMPWDEYRDGSDDELAAELAELVEEEAEWMAWVDALADEESAFAADLACDPDLAVPVATRPGLAKAHCRHGVYGFALVGGVRHARCRDCGHSWLVVVSEGETDTMPANMPGIANR